MEYQEYFKREDLLELVESKFPYAERPADEDLYSVGDNDLLRRIIQRNIEKYIEPQLPYDGVTELYDELGSLTSKAIQWLLPSMLRIILGTTNKAGHLSNSLVWYFENTDYTNDVSPYNFSWLTLEQIRVLILVLEYLSEEFGEAVALAQENLNEYQKTRIKGADSMIKAYRNPF